MEKLNLQCCQQRREACRDDKQVAARAATPYVKAPEMAAEPANKAVQKPWSVFEGVYWI